MSGCRDRSGFRRRAGPCRAPTAAPCASRRSAIFLRTPGIASLAWPSCRNPDDAGACVAAGTGGRRDARGACGVRMALVVTPCWRLLLRFRLGTEETKNRHRAVAGEVEVVGDVRA